MAIKYTRHAKEMLVLRAIKKELANETANNPDEILPTRKGKKIYLKDLGKNYLMKISYDLKADAAYIYFLKNKKSTRTEEVGEGLLVDYNGDDLVGIEILDVSKKFPKDEMKSIASIEKVAYPGAVAHKISR